MEDKQNSSTLSVPGKSSKALSLASKKTSKPLNDRTIRTPVVVIRHMLSVAQKPPIDDVVNANVIPHLVQCLRRTDNPKLQFEALWSLTNIASGTPEHVEKIISSGALPLCVALTLSTDDDVREQAMWCLSNISGDSAARRDHVLRLGALEPILKIISTNPKASTLRIAAWAMSNMCRGKPAPDFELVQPAVAVAASLLNNTDEEVLSDACWTMSYLSDGKNRIQSIIETKTVKRLVELLLHPNVSVQTPALMTVGNILTGTKGQTQVVLNASALTNLGKLLEHTDKNIRKNACWAISNVAAGTRDQVRAVIESGVVPGIVKILANADAESKLEAAWVIRNISSRSSDEQVEHVVTNGCLKPMCDVLTEERSEISFVALECLEFILECGARNKDGANKYLDMIKEVDGLEKIKSLRKHKDQKVADKAVKLLEIFFGLKGKKKKKEEQKKTEKKKKKSKKQDNTEHVEEKDKAIDKQHTTKSEQAIVQEPDMTPSETSTETQEKEKLVSNTEQLSNNQLLAQIEELKTKLEESERLKTEYESQYRKSIEREQKIINRFEQVISEIKREHAMALEMEKIQNERLQPQLEDEEWRNISENASGFMTRNATQKGIKRVVVCDANVFLSGTQGLRYLLSNDNNTPLLIGVPFSVVKELEEKKCQQDNVGKNAREALAALDKRPSGTIVVQRIEDIPTNNSVVKLCIEDLIVKYAAELAKSERTVVAFISSDTALRVKARGYPNELVLYESPDAYVQSLKSR